MLKLIIGIVLGISVGAMAQGTTGTTGAADPKTVRTESCVYTTDTATPMRCDVVAQSIPIPVGPRPFYAAGIDSDGNLAGMRMDAKGRVIARCEIDP